MLVISAGKNEIFDFALPMGVGLVDMAINLTKFLQKRACIVADEKGINLKNIDPHYLAKIEAKFANLSNPELQNLSQNFSKNPERNLYQMPEKIVFVGSAGLYKDGENMEFYSVLKVAQIFKIPAYGIFVATNFCNKNAHTDFIKNHAEAKKILTKYIKENM